MVAITAQLVLDRNNYTVSEISTTNLEYLIDDVIRAINFECGTSISAMSGAAGSKTVTVTDNQSVVIHSLIVLMMKAYLDRGPNVNIASMAVTTMLQDPQYMLFNKMWKMGINRLRGRSIDTV